MSKLKIAVIQSKSICSDLDDALEIGLKKCKKAKGMGTDIIVFPEMWSIGYMPPFENAFDFPEKQGHEEDIKHWYSLAIDENSEFIKSFCKCAKELETAILITYLKKGEAKPYNSSALIDINGEIVQNYSKVHTCDFSMEQYCQSGKHFYVSDLHTSKGIIKTGVMICFDREFPESARTLASKGAELILVPNCCPMDDNRKSQLKAQAFENMTAIAMANYAGSGMGGSMVFDGMAYYENGGYRDMLLLELDESEQIGIAEIDIDSLRRYREREVWGLKYTKPYAYDNNREF